jgi:hypothetical protein
MGTKFYNRLALVGVAMMVAATYAAWPWQLCTGLWGFLLVAFCCFKLDVSRFN